MPEYIEFEADKEVTLSLGAYSAMLWDLASCKQSIGRLYAENASLRKKLEEANAKSEPVLD